MSKWTSVLGKWKPAKERVILQISDKDLDAGKSPVYEGPDRSALEQLDEAGMIDRQTGEILDTFGVELHKNPDMILKAKQFGYTDVYLFLKEVYGIDRKTIEDKAKEYLSKPAPKEELKKVAPVKEIGGGRDYSGSGKHREGGLGDPTDVPDAALKARA